MRATRSILPAIVLVGLAVMTSHADVAPVGPEFQASAPGSSYRENSAVAADATGRFVVVWDDSSYFGSGTDGSASGVFGRRYDAAGMPTGSQFQVNTYTTGTQYWPSVATDQSGAFVVTWSSGSYYGDVPPDGSAVGVFLQRFDESGGRLGDEEQVNTHTLGSQVTSDVAADDAGNFVIVWTSGGYDATQDGDRAGIFGQRFGVTGAPAGGEFQVNTFTTGAQNLPAVAMLSTGGFVVVWNGWGSPPQDGDESGVFAQRFDVTGAPTGSEFQVNSYTTGSQYMPDVAPLLAGGFVVTWENSNYYGADGPDGSGSSIAARRFAADGTPIGTDVQVNTFTTSNQRQAAVAADQDGNFVVTWQSGGYSNESSPDGSRRAISAQHFASDGTPLGAELVVNTYTPFSQERPAIAGDGRGGFVVTWNGYKGGDSGIFGQRFDTIGVAAPIPLAGTKLVLKDAPDPARRKITLASRDPGVTAGAGDGSLDDPTRTGGTLRVRSVAFDDTYPLPAANWRSLGGNLGYEYRDPHRLAGPIVRVRVRRGRLLDVRGQGAQLGHTLASNPRPVTITLQSGTLGERSCMAFGGGYAFKPGRVFKATNAPAPAACAP